ncbi:MAG: fused MFS/spermidine synthase [Planctomycetes bacterium]|nr:fused MFS/spermidine synthase [Planctomycetota bacterium]
MTAVESAPGRDVPIPVAAMAAAATGFAVMLLELTAVRLFAPVFGDSQYVWTNVIGVILLALALGAFLGGRLADRGVGRKGLSGLLVVAAGLVGLVPLIGPPLGAWLAPADLPLDSAMAALVRGSLVASSLLFALPVLLVAAVSPVLVVNLARADGRVGRASALVSWTATLGSVVGTFVATHWLIPEVGSRWTVWIAAVCLAAAALLCRFGAAGSVVGVLPLGWSLLAPDHLEAAGPGEVVRDEVESPYQFLQVVEVADSDPRRTLLRINEGLDSFHSVALAGTPYTGGGYYDYHVVAPYLAGDGAAPPHLRVLSLGDAAGTFGRLYEHVHHPSSMDRVELDPAVSRLGDAFFPGKQPEGERFALDARVFVDRTQRTYDVVLLDTYKHQIYLPAHVASAQFFRGVRRVLREGGIVSVNAGGVRFDDPVVRVLGDTMARVFGESWAFRIPNSRNFMLVARRDKPLDPGCLARVAAPPSDAALQQVLARTSVPGSWHAFPQRPGAEVLDDDRPFLDALQERAYRGDEASPGLLAMHGARPPDEILGAAVGLLQAGRLEECRDVFAGARAATGPLRVLAGDCRWRLRDARGAAEEYREALRLGVPEAQRVRVEENLKWSSVEADGRGHARRVGRRNGWLAVGVVLLAAVGFVAASRSTVVAPGR